MIKELPYKSRLCDYESAIPSISYNFESDKTINGFQVLTLLFLKDSLLDFIDVVTLLYNQYIIDK